MKTSLLLVLVLMLVIDSSFARIGETEAQIEQRYGKFIPPIITSAVPMKMYRAAGMLIGVSYIDGRSESEMYQRSDDKTFNDHEIELLLEANSAGNKWEKTNSISLTKDNWTREGAIAAYEKYSMKPTLMVMSDRFVRIATEKNKNEEKEKLKDF